MPPRKQAATLADNKPTATRALRKRPASPERVEPLKKQATKENVTVKPGPGRPRKTAIANKTKTDPKDAEKTRKKPGPKPKQVPKPVEEEDKPPPRKRVRKSEEPHEPSRPLTPFVPANPVNPLPTPPTHTRPSPQIFVWGAGNFGQFGMGHQHLGELDKPKRNTWVEHGISEGKFGDEGAGIEAIAAGGLHTMFIDESGKIWTCGVNDDAALGRPTKDVPDPENPGKFLNIDILLSTPHVIQTLVNEGFRAVRITAGDSISAAIGSDGSLRVWGSFKAEEGTLGFSNELKHSWTPAPILPNKANTNRPEACVAIASGNNHIIALTATGAVYAWGAAERGQLGRKILERRKIHGVHPEKVSFGARNHPIVAIGAGSYTSFAVDQGGAVWGWGLNNMGQTGTNSGYDNEESIIMTPKLVHGLSPEDLGGERVVQIAGGEHHTVFLTSGGRVFTCGRGDGGQLGLPDDHPVIIERREMINNDPLDYIVKPTPVEFPVDATEDPIVSISAGIRNNVAISRDGALYSWGEGNQGELGLGMDTNASSPTVVVRRTGGKWSAIGASCGGQHSLGLFVPKKTEDD